MGRGEIRKESKGKKSSKDTKQKATAQNVYVAAEVISKKKDKENW